MTGRPLTKAARHDLVAKVIAGQELASQAEIVAALQERGVQITQATLSRDLIELRAHKVRTAHGFRYSVPPEGPLGESVNHAGGESVPAVRLAKLCQELLLSAEASANLVVLRTPPGAAQFLASAIDHSIFAEILGTIAGDDTVLVITKVDDGAAVAQKFLTLASGQ